MTGPGEPNDLIRAITEDFASRFVPGSRLVYVRSAADKPTYSDSDRLYRPPFSPYDVRPFMQVPRFRSGPESLNALPASTPERPSHYESPPLADARSRLPVRPGSPPNSTALMLVP